MGLVIGIDTGGTFTDMVVFDPRSGHVDSLKTSSTPATPGRAIVNALDEGGVAAAAVETFTHGTTVGTNALIERTGCKVAFVTTNGLRGHAVHPAHQPQGALRPALDEDRSRSSRAGGSASASTSGSTPTARRCGRSTRPRCASSAAAIRERRRRGGRALPALLLRPHRPRGAREGDPRRGAAGHARSRSPPRWRRSGASTSAPRRRSPMPTCGRCSDATSRASTARSATPG